MRTTDRYNYTQASNWLNDNDLKPLSAFETLLAIMEQDKALLQKNANAPLNYHALSTTLGILGKTKDGYGIAFVDDHPGFRHTVVCYGVPALKKNNTHFAGPFIMRINTSPPKTKNILVNLMQQAKDQDRLIELTPKIYRTESNSQIQRAMLGTDLTEEIVDWLAQRKVDKIRTEIYGMESTHPSPGEITVRHELQDGALAIIPVSISFRRTKESGAILSRNEFCAVGQEPGHIYGKSLERSGEVGTLQQMHL
jgi:hypothetical protein